MVIINLREAISWLNSMFLAVLLHRICAV